MSSATAGYLDFIPSMAAELPDIVTGKPTTTDRLHLAAGVCGWIMDYEHDHRAIHIPASFIEEYDVEILADIGRAYLIAAIRKHEQENNA